jgi:hypothetical protein
MRRTIGIILAGLGAFLLVLAIAVRTYVPGQVLKIPLNEYLVTTLVGHNVSYFSPAKVKPITGATMTVTNTLKSDGSAGTSSTAVWNQFTYLYDQTNRLEFQYSITRFAFDRKTAQLVHCCGANVNGNPEILQSGLANGLWPIGTQKQTYLQFDSTADKALPVHFAGTGTVSGIPVYKFVEKVTNLKIGTQTLPASLVGLPGTSDATLPEYYTASNTYFVDPVTGAQLNQVINQHLTLSGANGQGHLQLMNASLTFTPQSQAKVVSIDNSARAKVTLLEVVLPLAAGGLGLILLVAGILLARPRQDEQPDYDDSETDAPVLDPAR